MFYFVIKFLSLFILPSKSLELAKLSNITEKAQKLEEAAKIREELNLNFSKQAEQKLIQKMESNKENRAAQLNNLLEKLKRTVLLLLLLFLNKNNQKSISICLKRIIK